MNIHMNQNMNMDSFSGQ